MGSATSELRAQPARPPLPSRPGFRAGVERLRAAGGKPATSALRGSRSGTWGARHQYREHRGSGPLSPYRVFPHGSGRYPKERAGDGAWSSSRPVVPEPVDSPPSTAARKPTSRQARSRSAGFSLPRPHQRHDGRQRHDLGPTPIAWPDDIQAQGRLSRVGTPAWASVRLSLGRTPAAARRRGRRSRRRRRPRGARRSVLSGRGPGCWRGLSGMESTASHIRGAVRSGACDLSRSTWIGRRAEPRPRALAAPIR